MTVWDRLEREIKNDPIVHAAYTMSQTGRVATDEAALVIAVIGLVEERRALQARLVRLHQEIAP